MKKQLLILVLFFFLALPSFGQILWQNTYGLANSYEQLNKMIPLSNGGYLLTGYQRINNGPVATTYAVRTNSVGDTVWTKKHRPASRDFSYVNDVVEDAGGNLILAVTGKL